jgi:DNA-binding FrmR family transcriptional regulator
MESATNNRKKLLNRVRRIRGQIDSIERALTESQEDATTLQTLAACRGAIAGLMVEIVEERVRLHLLDPIRDATNQARIAQEVHELFRTYLK